jgi:hypothetical protein
MLYKCYHVGVIIVVFTSKLYPLSLQMDNFNYLNIIIFGMLLREIKNLISRIIFKHYQSQNLFSLSCQK